MSFRGGRGGRSDDWATPHARARARATEALDQPLHPTEQAWLDDHLVDCPSCRQVAAEYAAQRLELRRLRDRPPTPPRDLWARTSAAIEREARSRARQPRPTRRSLLAPYAVLGGALVVAVVVGTLSTFRTIPPETDLATTSPSGTPPPVATATAVPGATPLAVGAQKAEWLSVASDGTVRINVANVDEVCPEDADPCDQAAPAEARSVELLTDAASVFGSMDGERLIVVADDGTAGPSLYVVPVAEPAPTGTPSPSVEPTPSSTASASPTASPTASATPPPSSSAPPSGEPTASPTGPPDVSPTPDPGGAIEIARDVDVVDTSAAYSESGRRFAFSARPSDETVGPDVFVWQVGETEARPITTDHRSVFGSWLGDVLFGSTAVVEDDGTVVPSAFAIDPESGEVLPLPQVGRAWRPAVEPSGWSAVYWNGTLEPTEDGLAWTTRDGDLVLGRWGTGTAAPTEGPAPTPLETNQAEERNETTIASGPIAAWDARWDESGRRLAVWIADPANPTVGTLSLYVVDPFDGSVDLDTPLLADAPALAGFSISEGRLVWAEPNGVPGAESKRGRIRILAWTDEGSGTVESMTGEVIVIR